MASHLRAVPRAVLPPPHKAEFPNVVAFLFSERSRNGGRSRNRRSLKIKAVGDGESYLGMWKKALDRERKAAEFKRIVENSVRVSDREADGGDEESVEDMERKSDEFKKLLEVPKEERDRVQRMQVIDRAAAAIAAARAVLKESNSSPNSGSSGNKISKNETVEEVGAQQEGTQGGILFVPQTKTNGSETPGPDFWSWTPPDDEITSDTGNMQTARNSLPYPITTSPVLEKEQAVGSLSIPFESELLKSKPNPLLPPLQSSMDVENIKFSTISPDVPTLEEEHKLGMQFSVNAEEAARALDNVDEASSSGINPDGSRWWRETGIEQRPDGVVCKWTLTRGVSADNVIEWEDKYWEAADQFDYKELGSEKSGRDASGNVWREYWRESMRQESGFVHFEKTADKWGKNGKGDEWQEKWWEHYDASGKAEKWAHKWCSIDPSTHVEAGHAHVWHERWGEKYDGLGGSMKYTDKWAECCEGGAWTKWGDKWDENFDLNGHGVKQGETWWEGKHGERWNRTWGEQHNGSGWVHKYGKSSSGQHWDTHVQQDTWYERFPHFGFWHCFENSVHLREVRRPSETQ